jgi:hypothetical protein
MILATLLAAAPMMAQAPIDATLPNLNQPPVNQNSGSSGRGTTASDDFNRTALGADWNVQTGNIDIYNNMGRGVTNMSMMTHASGADNYDTSTLTSVFDSPGGLVYVAMVAGYADVGTNVFVKVQDNTSDGEYDRVFFYMGNNGGSWSGNSGYYFDLATPTKSGTMTLSFSGGGDTAELEIENDASGALERFRCSGLSAHASSFGTGVGVGTYGNCYFDDWSLNGGGGISLTSTGSAGGAMTFDVSGATAFGVVAVCYAFGTGSHRVFNPITGNTVTTGLSSTRFTIAAIGAADASGNYTLARSVPSGAAGRVHVQAVDANTDGCSNVLSL